MSPNVPTLRPLTRAARALGAIFEQEKAVPLRHVAHAANIARRAAHVGHHDPTRVGGDAALNIRRIKTEGVVDICEHRNGAEIHDRCGDRHP